MLAYCTVKPLMPELVIQLEPRRAVFAGAKIAKDKLNLPLVSTKLCAFSTKQDFSNAPIDQENGATQREDPAEVSCAARCAAARCAAR